MRWMKFAALSVQILLLALLSGGGLKPRPLDALAGAPLKFTCGAAHAGGLGDVFGEKNDEAGETGSDEDTDEGQSDSQEEEKKDDSGGLADVFGEKDNDGGDSGPYTTEPEKPPSRPAPYPPAYEDYPEAHPRPRPASSSNSPAGAFEAALEDITLSWLQSDTSYLERHLPPDDQVRIYRGTRLLQTLSSEEFLKATTEGFQNFKTISFSFGKPHYESNAIAYCPAEHLLAGADGVLRRAQVGYELQRLAASSAPLATTTEPSPTPSEWVIRSVNEDISELLRARCFIATAAFGTPLAEEVQMLREFRDRYLLTNPAGRLFVNFYYRASPPLARAVSRDRSLAWQVRLLLKPVVGGCQLVLGG